MQSARALIIDRDRSFSERLGRCLKVVSVKADVVEGRREALERIKASVPAIVFIAVESPKKVGFSLFSDVKRLVKTNPIVLMTSTLPSTELLLHQKLRLHADAYLDKRELTESDILATLDRVMHLNLDATDLAELSRDAIRDAPSPVTKVEPSRTDETGGPETEAASKGQASDDEAIQQSATDESHDAALGSLDPDLVALLSDADADRRFDASLDADHDDGLDDDESGNVERFREQLDELQRDLEIARRAASSSPFSSEYLKLSDQAARGERVSARMRRKLDARDGQNAALRSKLREIAGRLLTSERALDRAVEQARKTDERLVSIEADLGRQRERVRDLERRLSEETAKGEGLERDLRTTTQELQNRTAEYERQTEEAAAEHHSEQTGIRTHYEATLENLRAEFELERRTLKEGHEAALEGQHEDMRIRGQKALDEQETEWRQKLQESLNRHALALETIRKEHQNEVVELQGSMERSILRKEQETEARIRVAAAEAESTRTREIGELEKKHLESLQELQRQYDAELERRRTEHESTLKFQSSEMQQREVESLESRDAAWQHRLDELGRQHERSFEAQSQEHRKELAELHGSLEEAVRRKDQELEAKFKRSMENREKELRKELRDAEQRHEKSLRETREQLVREQVEALARKSEELRSAEQRHEESLQETREELKREHEATLARQIEDVRNENGTVIDSRDDEWRERLQEERERLEGAFEDHRAEHARKIAELEAAHAQALEDKDREHAEALEDNARENAEAFERAIGDLQDEHNRTRSERLNELEQAEKTRRADLAELQRHYRDEIELLKKLHESEIERLKARHAREQERMRNGLEAPPDPLAGERRAKNPKRLDARLEDVQQEHSQALAADRVEIRSIVEALEATQGSGRAPEGGADGSGGGDAGSNDLLRQLADALDRVDRRLDGIPDPPESGEVAPPVE